MNLFRGMAIACAVLSGCVSTEDGVIKAIENYEGVASAAPPRISTEGLQSAYNVVAFRISVPDSLTVSEANLYMPISDIVWRGDPLGDRHVQIKAMFEKAAQTASPRLKHGPSVVAEVVVTRFHALTEKARYTVGGKHTIRFVLTLRDPKSGEVLAGPRLVNADVAAAGGQAALNEDAAGLTQKVVITQRLVEVFLAEMSHRVEAN